MTFKITEKPAVTKLVRRMVSGVMKDVKDVVSPAVVKTYTLAPIDLDDLGFVEQHLLALRQHPEKILEKMLPSLKTAAQQEMCINIVFRRLERGYNKVSNADIAEYVDTPDGLVMTFWLMVRKNHPEVDSVEAAKKLFDKLSREEVKDFTRRRDLASGTGLLGNSTGRSGNGTAPAAKNGPKSPNGTSQSTGDTHSGN